MVPADSPGTLTGNCFGIWVEQNFIFVKEQSFFRTVWSVYTVGIFKFINVQSIRSWNKHYRSCKLPEKEVQQKVLPVHGGTEAVHRRFLRMCEW